MRNRFVLALIILFGLSNGLFAQEYVAAEEAGSLTVNGDSTIHKWHATTSLLQGGLTLTEGAPTALTVSVPVLELKSGKKGLDKKMYKAMETDTHSAVKFVLSSAAVPKEIPEGMEGDVRELTGDLTILESTQKISILVTIKQEEGKLILEGSKTLDMTDYGVKPPKAMMGTIKTDPEITVEFNWVLKPKAAE